ncbi:Leucine carboxyl methyltransferase 1 [Psilocybe cubensis]|uniref:Leucine carboxyl methyltransferase 1 n=1 Tax=Psilocybe cubensis TaxID=181762 RepID=A0ACB8HC48_PSICU|nr:Leucine carboxyl methyltransferase 1 [Psilocybe cubensis]KAH9485575.1 Leucine carboxyl methyltransferase 1 [Psilocybe cubensis]
MFPPSTAQAGDAPIRSTDNDAAVARLSAVQKGYLNDPYIKYLVPRAHLISPRPPLINIGTYVRSAGIDALVDQWIELSARGGLRCQIISLGSGSDTRFWRIAARQGGTALHSEKYHLLPADLRLSPSDTIEPMLFSANTEYPSTLDPSLPTLLLFECVLVYMEPQASSRLLEYFIKVFERAQRGVLGCVIYEMFGLNDAFGRVMINNLKERHIALPGALPYTTKESLSNRFLRAGFIAAVAVTLDEIKKAYIAREELERISKVEFLDETEELDLVLAHYAISWGLFLGSRELGSHWGHWGLTKKS